jgi:hypothetical protein
VKAVFFPSAFLAQGRFGSRPFWLKAVFGSTTTDICEIIFQRKFSRAEVVGTNSLCEFIS